MKRPQSLRPLSIEEIETVAEGFKDDLLRTARRLVRRHDSTGATAALESMEYVDNFVSQLRLKAGSQLGQPRRPARARPIHLFTKRGGEQ
jgi:hypothetical protein